MRGEGLSRLNWTAFEPDQPPSLWTMNSPNDDTIPQVALDELQILAGVIERKGGGATSATQLGGDRSFRSQSPSSPVAAAFALASTRP